MQTMLSAVFVALLISVPCTATSAKAEVTPVQKVLELLGGMLEKGKVDKHEEQLQFAAYKQFCDDTSVEKTRAIKEATEKIVVLKADIEKYSADAALLAKEIAAHQEDISVWEGDKKAATKVRGIEAEDYAETHKSYTESIDALGRAIVVLKKQAYDRPQVNEEAQVAEEAQVTEEGSSLMQVAALTKLHMMPLEAKAMINTFLAQQDQPVSAPEANAYNFQSAHIVEFLEKLLDKFKAEKTNLEKEEMNAKSAYELLVQDLDAQLSQAKQDEEQKSKTKAAKLEAKAQAENDLEDTTAMKEADEKYLAELTATCTKKATDFEARQQLRTEEITAIETAMEIIAGGKVSGNADKYLPSLLQTRKSSLSQLRAEGHSVARTRVVDFLQSKAKELQSRVLYAVAERASDDPFGKVKKMIKDLITRLMEEAADESEHKGWCDTELSTNEQTRKEKTASVESLHAQIDELEASIAKINEQVAEMTEEIAKLDAAMSEATELRQAEKAKNTQTISDAQEAQEAVSQALVVLKEFYQKAGESTALIQEEPAEPEIFDTPYQGMQGAKGGVIGMLEVIESDFARLDAETKADEDAAQREYDEFMETSESDKSAKTADVEHLNAKKQDEEQALTIAQSDLEGNQKELNAALAYFDKLKPSCIDAGVSYEDRVERRKEEIESLQEALKILNGQDIA